MSIKSLRTRLGVSTCLLAMTAGSVQGATPASVTATRVSAFLATLGVNAHLNYNDGAYANVQQAISDLGYLGIRQIRTAVPDPNGGSPNAAYLQSLMTAENAGILMDYCVDAHLPLAQTVSQIAAQEAQHPGSTVAVEGPNEVNNSPVSYNGINDTSNTNVAANAFQKNLYAAVKGNARLANTAVYYLTGNHSNQPGNPAIDLGVLRPPIGDAANIHPYPYQGEAPGPRMAGEFVNNFTNPNDVPHVITEDGYFNQPNNPGGSGVDSNTQAKLTLDLLLDAYVQGVSKTYLYQLRSAYSDPNGNNSDTEYGLFNQDNTPKPVATSIHNLTTVLADPGSPAAAAGFTTGSLAYSVSSNFPATGHSTLLQRSDGKFLLVLWAEPTIWNEATHQPVVGSYPFVTVSFRSPVAAAALYDPFKSSAVQRTGYTASSVQVTVSDHPVVYLITQ